jgi:hypothetical protein
MVRAHDVAMAGEGADSAWVHAYLHRRDGDLKNAQVLVPAGPETAGNGHY